MKSPMQEQTAKSNHPENSQLKRNTQMKRRTIQEWTRRPKPPTLQEWTKLPTPQEWSKLHTSQEWTVTFKTP